MFNGPIAAAHVREEMPASTSVQAACPAGGDGRAGEGEEEIFTACAQAGHRHQRIDTIVEQPAPACPALTLRLRTLIGGGKFGAVDGCAATGDHVDHAEHRVLTVHRAARTWNVFDAFNQIYVKRKLPSHRSAVIKWVIDAIAVDEDQGACIVVPRYTDPPRAQIHVLAVVGSVNARQTGQRLVHGAPAERAYFIAGDDANGSRHVTLFLLIFGRTIDAQRQQLLQR